MKNQKSRFTGALAWGVNPKPVSVAWLSAGGVLALSMAGHLAHGTEFTEPISPLPLSVQEDPKRVAIGARLFGDKILSQNNVFACATCHVLNHGGADSRARAVAIDGKRLLRNTPSVFNLRFNLYLNWDGAHETLTKHTEAVLVNPNLTGSTWPEILAKLADDRWYALDFRRTYPDGITKSNVVDAIVSFERALITPNARFDKYLRGQKDAITADELKGYQLFKSFGCVSCHQGINVGGNLLQRFGVFSVPDTLGATPSEPDTGRMRLTKDPLDEFVFRVPSLRNVALTAPYFHDGRAKTLEDAVNLMARVQLGRTLNPQDIRLIVAFLRTLTGEVNTKALSLVPEGGNP